MIYTADQISVELFGVDSAADLTSEQAPLVTAALARTENAIAAFLRGSTGYAERVEVVSAGEPSMRSMLIPYESVERTADVIILKFRPVEASTVAVRSNDYEQVFESIHAVPATDWQLENVVDGWSFSGVLRRKSGGWPLSPGGTQVTYYSGLDATNAPNDWNIVRLGFLAQFRFEYGKSLAFKEVADAGSLDKLASESIGGMYSRGIDVSNSNKLMSGMSTSVNGLVCDEAYRIMEPLIRYADYI